MKQITTSFLILTGICVWAMLGVYTYYTGFMNIVEMEMHNALPPDRIFDYIPMAIIATSTVFIVYYRKELFEKFRNAISGIKN